MGDLAGKTIVVTGGNSGIGYAVCGLLLKRGAHVIIASRNMQRVQQAVSELQAAHPSGKVEGMKLDLGSFRSIEEFANAYVAKGIRLDVLLNNAGLFFPPFGRTAEGFEMAIGVNHFGTIYLTELLLPVLKQSAPSRVVFVNSSAAEDGKVDWSDLTGEKATVSNFDVYNYSKAAQFMVSRVMGKELQGTGVDMVAADPGFVDSGLLDKSTGCLPRIFKLLNFMALTPEQGAAHIAFAVTDPSLTGKGFSATAPSKKGKNQTGVWLPKNPLLNNETHCQRMRTETQHIIASKAARRLPEAQAATAAQFIPVLPAKALDPAFAALSYPGAPWQGVPAASMNSTLMGFPPGLRMDPMLMDLNSNSNSNLGIGAGPWQQPGAALMAGAPMAYQQITAQPGALQPLLPQQPQQPFHPVLQAQQLQQLQQQQQLLAQQDPYRQVYLSAQTGQQLQQQQYPGDLPSLQQQQGRLQGAGGLPQQLGGMGGGGFPHQLGVGGGGFAKQLGGLGGGGSPLAAGEQLRSEFTSQQLQFDQMQQARHAALREQGAWGPRLDAAVLVQRLAANGDYAPARTVAALAGLPYPSPGPVAPSSVFRTVEVRPGAYMAAGPEVGGYPVQGALAHQVALQAAAAGVMQGQGGLGQRFVPYAPQHALLA